MYDKLFDTVSQIVKTYGASIFDDPKFWHILTDSYSFASDFSIRDAFKECIKRGYISQIAALRPNSKKTIATIDNLSKAAKRNGLNDDDVALILFSIAIGIGSCNRSDFKDYTTANRSGAKPRHNPYPHKSHFKWYEYLIAFGFYLFGIIASIGATIFYSAICNGWWLFFIIILMGFGQVAFIGSVMNYFESLKNDRFKYFLKSILTPILIAIIFNSLLSFAFFSEAFRTWFAHHIHCWKCDEPTFISFFLAVFYVLFITFGSICCIDSDFSIANLKKVVLRRSFFISLSFISVLYCLMVFGPNIGYQIEKERILQEETEKDEVNNSLRKARANIVQDLSFRGIKVGISIDTGKGFLSNFTDSDDTDHPIEIAAQAPGEVEPIEHYYTYFRKPDNKYETLTKAYTGTPSSGNWDLTGELVEKNINIDNQQVRLKLFEQEGLVFAIVILPKYGNYYFSDFESLKELYTKKYSTPEIEGDVLRWSYKNGFIAISNSFIIYTSNAFDKAINTAHKEKIDKAKRELEREKVEKRKNDSIKAAQEKEDSIRRVQNHKNAINEI